MTSRLPLPPLRRALLHPVWLGAIAVLALNDHVLKGSGVLPGWLTGKLSDVMGLFAAPLLLAVLVRVSSRRGWALAHIAIGAVFSAIQLSEPAADLWSSAMGLVGFPWVITRDVTDLLALPALLLSFCWVPTLATRNRTEGAAEVVVATAGVMACVATSPPPGGPIFGSFNTDTYLHNDNDFDIVVRLRRLKDSVELDCDVVEEDPARYLREPLFGDAESWTLAPDATMPVIETWDRPTNRQCHAAWVDADNLAPSIIFWREGQFPIEDIEGSGLTADTQGWISIAFDDDGRGRYDSEEELAFPIEALPPTEPGVCTPSSAATRLAWGELPVGEWRVGAVDVGIDGCVQLDLRTGFEHEQGQPGKGWDVCLPPGAFPFEVDDLVSLTGNEHWFQATRLDPNTGNEEGAALVASRLAASSTVFGTQALVEPAFDCEPIADETCGTVRRATSVSVVGGGFESVSISTGQREPVQTQSERYSLELHLVHASERLVADAECNSQLLGADVEMVAVRRDRGE